MKKTIRFLIVCLVMAPTLLIAQSPVTHFSASKTAICDSIYTESFTDQSTNNPTRWKWYFPGAAPDTSTLQNPTNIIYKGYGCYTVKLIVKNNSGADSLTYSNYICLNAPPHVTLTGPNALCKGSQATITAYGGTQYHWDNGATTSSINVTGVVTKTYTVEVSSGACYKDTSFTIAVGDVRPKWKFEGDTSICVGDSTTIFAFPSNGSYKYSWSTGATTDSILVQGLTPGLHIYNLTINNIGCVDSEKITVGVNVCTGIENYSNSSEFTIYPNPSNGIFILQTVSEHRIANSYIEVYNVLGQQVYRSSINAISREINIGGQRQGVYLYRITTETGSLVSEGKLIIE